MKQSPVSFNLDIYLGIDGQPRAQLIRRDPYLDYGELSLGELRFVIEAVLPPRPRTFNPENVSWDVADAAKPPLWRRRHGDSDAGASG